MGVFRLEDRRVVVPASGRYWVAHNATVVGSVTLGEDVSIWFGTVIRADNDPIRIGDRTNIQDNSVLHADPGLPLDIGPDCTIGHMAVVHGCTVGRGSLIGIGAIVLNGAKIGEECMIGAGALIPEGKEIPPRSVVLGSPGKVIRQVTEQDLARIRLGTDVYVNRWKSYAAGLKPAD